MSTFRHPAFPEIQQTVPDARDDDMAAAGWVPLLDAEQKLRLTELELEAELETPHTPPPAVRKQTPIGPGQVPKGNQA